MALNTDGAYALEHLNLIIGAFEKEALNSSTRSGILAAANGPLSSMDALLESSDKVLSEGASKGRKKKDKQSVDPSSGAAGSFSADADLEDLLARGDQDLGWAGEYLSECLGCDFRLQFDWQLKPLNLLGEIEQLLANVMAALDAFELRFDPFKSLEGLCNLLNALKGFCIPDLIMVLMSLKMLIKRYTMNVLEISIDWTTLLGPLLKIVLQGVCDLLNNLMHIMLAPLDCTISGLATANRLEKEARKLIEDVGQLANGQFATSTSLDLTVKDVGWSDNDFNDQDTTFKEKIFGDFPRAPEFGKSVVASRDITEKKKTNGVTIPTGFHMTADMRLDDALKDPAFANATFIEKLLVPVQEAKLFIQDLITKVTRALKSLNDLVSGGLTVNLVHIGALLFLIDMVSMVVMIIKMLGQHRNGGVEDWCKLLEENPSVLEEVLRPSYGRVSVEKSPDNNLLLRLGPDVVGQVITCANQKTDTNKSLINQWIRDLEGGK